MSIIVIVQTDQLKSSLFMNKFYIWQDIFTKFDLEYYPGHHYNLWTNCSDRIGITYI